MILAPPGHDFRVMAEESNARYKYLLAQGTTGLSVAFDLPTQIGLDSDDPLSAGEVGKVGVAMATSGPGGCNLVTPLANWN